MNGRKIGGTAYDEAEVYNGALGNGDSDGVRYGVAVFFDGLQNCYNQTRGLHFVCNIAS